MTTGGGGQSDSPPPTVDEKRLALFYELGCAFAERTSLDELIPLVIAKCRETLGAHGAAVLLHDPATDELYFPYVAQERPSVAAELLRTRFPAHLGHAGAVLRSGRPSRHDDASADPCFYGQIDIRTRSQTGPMLTVPLATRQGTIGVIQVVNQKGGPCFTDEDLAFLEALASSVAVAIVNARLYARMRAEEETLREEVAALRHDLKRQDRFPEIVGASPAMREVLRLMERAAASPIAVLVQGETGTGKELVARGIHAASPRAGRRFLPFNCGALPAELVESELFGHRRGAFTGALQDKRGLFEAAQGGTIFLDEVGDMPRAMQAKLLRVLEEGVIIPVGASEPRKVDVRVISATNRDLAAEVECGRFRSDLYYRLAAFPIRLPPLREREGDVELLVTHILDTIAARLQRPPICIEAAALERLARYPWPGNVRQLQHEIERAVALLGRGETIRVEHLSPAIACPPRSMAAPSAKPVVQPPGPGRPIAPLRDARAEFEQRYIEEVLAARGGNVSQAAAALGISRAALHKRLARNGVNGSSGAKRRKPS